MVSYSMLLLLLINSTAMPTRTGGHSLIFSFSYGRYLIGIGYGETK